MSDSLWEGLYTHPARRIAIQATRGNPKEIAIVVEE
jgi:hypothetical protein